MAPQLALPLARPRPPQAAEYAPAEERGAAGPPLQTLLVVRAALGDPAYLSHALKNARRPPERGDAFTRGTTYDSVVATTVDTRVGYGPLMDSGEATGEEHREIVLYDHRHVYPEYIVRFRRGKYRGK